MATTRLAMAKKKLDDKSNQNDDNTKNEADLSANDDEPNFSDPEGFVDSLTEEGIYIQFVAVKCAVMTLFNICVEEKVHDLASF